MPNDMSQLEEAVFQSMVPQLEAEGYSVFIHPSKDMLPLFLNTYYPDAVAYKGNRKIAIEIMGQPHGDTSKTEYMRKIFSDHPDWELRLVYAPPRVNEEAIPALSRELIEEYLQHIEDSIESMGATTALLIAWATFEAAARRLTPINLARAQSPSRLIEVLASEGYVTPDEADILRDLSPMWNEIAHGRLDLRVNRERVEDLARITRAILRLDG